MRDRLTARAGVGQLRALLLEIRRWCIEEDVAADLHALFSAANLPGPYILVAHSWGGLNARFYASTYPDEVSGLVLLDAGSEFLQDTLTPPEQWQESSKL